MRVGQVFTWTKPVGILCLSSSRSRRGLRRGMEEVVVIYSAGVSILWSCILLYLYIPLRLAPRVVSWSSGLFN